MSKEKIIYRSMPTNKSRVRAAHAWHYLTGLYSYENGPIAEMYYDKNTQAWIATFTNGAIHTGYSKTISFYYYDNEMPESHKYDDINNCRLDIKQKYNQNKSRIDIIGEEIDNIINFDFKEHLTRSFYRHGAGSFISSHEGLGVITEEYHELIEAIKSNDIDKIQSECMDVAVSAIWLYASLVQNSKKMENQ